MTKEEMIELAKQSGWEYAHGESGFEPLWAFARLVADKEREACAEICDGFYLTWIDTHKVDMNSWVREQANVLAQSEQEVKHDGR